MTRRRRSKKLYTDDEAQGESPAPSGDKVTWRDFLDFANPLFTYAEHYLAPQKMAEMRRRRGDAAASPRDYDCGCPVPDDDCLPDCWPNRAECRFRNRMRPRPKLRNNKFAHALTRKIFADLMAELQRMPEPELHATIDKAAAFCRAHDKRTKRLRAEPAPEPAPLIESRRRDDPA